MQQEESKSQNVLSEIFETLSSQLIVKTYITELLATYTRNSLQEAELRAKAGASASAQQEAPVKYVEEKKDQRGAGAAKKKGKEVVTTLQFGVGSRKFFDYLLIVLVNA